MVNVHFKLSFRRRHCHNYSTSWETLARKFSRLRKSSKIDEDPQFLALQSEPQHVGLLARSRLKCVFWNFLVSFTSFIVLCRGHSDALCTYSNLHPFDSRQRVLKRSSPFRNACFEYPYWVLCYHSQYFIPTNQPMECSQDNDLIAAAIFVL